MTNASYGICPKCKNSNIFGVPAQFMGTAYIQNGDLDVKDYAFQGNITPKFHTNALVCNACGQTFKIEDVLTVETCEHCKSAYYQQDMVTVNNLTGTVPGSEHRVCRNCMVQLQPQIPQQTQLQPEYTDPITPDAIKNMSQEDLVAYALSLQAKHNMANGIVVTAPEEDITEQMNYMPDVQIDNATESMPINTATDASMPMEIPLDGAVTGQGFPVQTTLDSSENSASKEEARTSESIQGANGFTDTDISTNVTDGDTITSEMGNSDSNAEINERSATNDVLYVTPQQNAIVPNTIMGAIDPTAFPFQPTGVVSVQSAGSV